MQSPYLAQAVQEISRQGRLAARGILDGWAPAWHPARRRRSPRPSRAQARHGRVRPEAAPASARGVQIAAPQGWRGAARTSPRGGAGERPASRQPRLGRRRRQGLAAATQARPRSGRAQARRPRTPISPTQWGGRGRMHQRRNRARAVPGARPHGVRPVAGLALRRARVARATAGGQLDRAGLARPWPPHYPGQPRRGWTGRAAARRRPGRAGVRPAGRRGAGGTRPTAGGADGSPLSAASRRRNPPPARQRRQEYTFAGAGGGASRRERPDPAKHRRPG